MPTARLADRMSHVAPAASQNMIARVRSMRADGVDVLDFAQQQAPPEIALLATADKMNSAAGSAYSDPRGLVELRDAVATRWFTEHQVRVDPATDIIATVGAKEAILSALLTLVDKGDEVLVEDPGYISFEPLVRLVGATPVRVPLVREAGFRFPTDQLSNYLTSKTRLLLLCNPHNPSGRSLSADELAAIGAVAIEADFNVLVDEAYEHFTYDGREHVCLASLHGMYERTITVQTVSKIFNMTGWRVGWVVGPADVMAAVRLAHTHAVTCPATFAQAGAAAVIAAGIAEGDQPIADVVARYQVQRDAMVSGLRCIEGVSCHAPQGTFFVFPDISSFGLTSSEMCNYLLEEAHVAAVPGSAFGPNGEGHVRMVFKTDEPSIREGIDRISRALDRLAKQRPGGGAA